MSEKISFEEVGDSIAKFSAAITQWMKPQMEKMGQVFKEISKLPSFQALMATIESVAQERGISIDELISELGSANRLMGDFQSRYEWQLFLMKLAKDIERKKNGSDHLG